MTFYKTGYIMMPFTELGNVEKVPFWVEENCEFSFEHVSLRNLRAIQQGISSRQKII